MSDSDLDEGRGLLAVEDRAEMAYDDSGDDGPLGLAMPGAGKRVVQNQPHDEEVALSESESFGGRDEPPKALDASLIDSGDSDDFGGGKFGLQQPGSTFAMQYGQQEAKPGKLSEMARSKEGGAGAGEGGLDTGIDADGTSATAGAYNAMDFRHLKVSDEVRGLFEHIGRYKPHDIELDTKLKPFIPDFIPSVGGIDEFIKVPRPDNQADHLGLKVLDEPAARQSDPTVLTLQLRQLTKEAPGSQAQMIGRIEHSDEQKAKKIDNWIGSVAGLHKNKPAAAVNYLRKMPDIEALMQEWPPEMEDFIRNMKMPAGDLDLDLKTMVKMVCSILDIPVYENPIESLHLLFSLFLEFRSNPIFAGMGPQGGLGARLMAPSQGSWGARANNSAGSLMGGLAGVVPGSRGGLPSSSGGGSGGANVMTF